MLPLLQLSVFYPPKMTLSICASSHVYHNQRPWTVSAYVLQCQRPLQSPIPACPPVHYCSPLKPDHDMWVEVVSHKNASFENHAEHQPRCCAYPNDPGCACWWCVPGSCTICMLDWLVCNLQGHFCCFSCIPVIWLLSSMPLVLHHSLWSTGRLFGVTVHFLH